MKQILCERPHHLRMLEVEKPKPKEGEALIRIRRIGICGTDLHAFKGNQPYFTYPRVLGHELAGVIEAVGENPWELKTGDQVAVIPYIECGTCIACRNGKPNCCTRMSVLGVHLDGGMQEFLSVPCDHLIPSTGLPLDHAVLLEPLSIGAHAVRRSGVEPGETVLVIGAGPIGLAVMAFARQRGARVLAMDINEERLAFSQSWARVDGTVNASEQSRDRIGHLTNGDFPTIVFDATGNAKSMMEAFQFVAHGGKLVFVGLFKGEVTFSDPEFHKREMTLMGSRNATREDFIQVMASATSGEIDLETFISHRVPFDHMIEHYESWTQPQSKVRKIIIELP